MTSSVISANMPPSLRPPLAFLSSPKPPFLCLFSTDNKPRWPTNDARRKEDHGTRVGREKGRRGTSRPRGGRAQRPTISVGDFVKLLAEDSTLQKPSISLGCVQANIPAGRPGAVTICMENPEIPGRIQMECFIPVEIFRKKSITFRERISGETWSAEMAFAWVTKDVYLLSVDVQDYFRTLWHRSSYVLLTLKEPCHEIQPN